MVAVTSPTVPEMRSEDTRTIPTRRVDFGFPEADMSRHFMGDDLIASHVVVGLSCMFPDGEDFFVDSVRHYRSAITDPDLRRQVSGFIGQEAIHGREHRAFNARLGEFGYPTRYFEARVRIGLAILRRCTPAQFQLAVTAALEHWTATLAEDLLNNPSNELLQAPPEIQSLFLWHALEESEHKAVAFDVFEQVSGNYWVRVGAMRFISFFFQTALISGLIISLALDPATREPGRLSASLRRAKHSTLINRDVRRALKAYRRRGFHPDQQDTSHLLERWRDELFGPSGSLSDALKR